MTHNFGDKENAAGKLPAKYYYKICRGAWNEAEHKRDGCGRHFTKDSIVSVCPDCDIPLALIGYREPLVQRVPRIHLEKCVKCANNVTAVPCFGDMRKPENCRICGCRSCCQEHAALVKKLMSSKGAFLGWLRDRAKKADAEKTAELGETDAKPERHPMAAVMEGAVSRTVWGDEIPF
jgi:hypothetical protein